MKTSSFLHETDVAKMFVLRNFDAARQPGSGNQPHNPNDVKVKDADLMIECKTTQAKTMIVRQAWMRRVISKAKQFAMRGMVAIRFEHEWPSHFEDYMIVPMPVLLHLLECEREVGHVPQP
jgi:Holliday junction resolvase